MPAHEAHGDDLHECGRLVVVCDNPPPDEIIATVDLNVGESFFITLDVIHEDFCRVNYRSSGRSAFLPDGSEERSGVHSEQTSREIDIEVKRIIDELLEKTRRLLEDRKDTLKALSARLLELEVIDSEELKRVMEANTDGPRIVPGTDVQKRSSSIESDSTESEETSNSSESAS